MSKKTKEHRDYSRERRDRLRASGLCINGKNHAAPEPGKTKCWACLQVQRKGGKRAREERPVVAKPLETRPCAACGLLFKAGRKGMRFCQNAECVRRRASVKYARRQDKARARGFCGTCRWRPTAGTHKTCRECLDRVRRYDMGLEWDIVECKWVKKVGV